MGNGLMPWHKNWLTDIEYNRVDLVKEGANSKAHIKLFKSKGGSDMNPEEILAKMKPDHADVIKKALEKAQKEAADAVKKSKEAENELEELKKQREGTAVQGASEEDILKSVKDPAVKALLETQIAKAKAAEEKVRKAQEEQLSNEAIAKAKEVPNLGAEEQKLIDVYKKLKDTDAELCADVFGIFKAASALIEDGGAIGEIGRSGETSDGASSDEEAAWNKIDKAADEIVKSQNLSKSEAIQKIIDEHPEMYDEYVNAQHA